jgi:hypothetical protein
MVQILKSSAEAKWEERLRQKDSKCPECRKIAMFSILAEESVGFFGLKTRRRTEYTCDCGCRWATDWTQN